MKVPRKQQKEYFDIFEVQFSLGFITVHGGNLCWLVSLIQIVPVILMIESLLQVMFLVWNLDLSLGLVKNNKLLLFLQQAEYRATVNASQEALWLRQILSEFEFER